MELPKMIQGAPGAWRARAQAAGAAVPVIMVNGTAFIGQFAFIQAHVPWPFIGQTLVAVTFETVAVYLAWQAHLATMADDSATRIKLGAYLFALIMGCMNYSHYAGPHLHPTFMAVGMFLMSTISPLLWGIHTRRSSRDKLMARGLVEPHAVRLGATRWTWHLYRSAVTTWLCTWSGENDPKRAIAMYEERKAARQARAGARQELARRNTAQPELAQHDVPSIAAGAPEVPAQPAGAPEVLPGTELNGEVVQAIAPLRAKAVMSAKHDIDPARLAAAEAYLASLPAGARMPSQRDLAGMLCDESHDHRRQAQPLLAAEQERRAAAAAHRLRSFNGGNSIAAPVATLPGGTQAHG